MRNLSPEFMDDLLTGKLKSLLKAVRKDRDLILELRNNALNIYYKGHSLLALSKNGKQYRMTLHAKFQVDKSLDLNTISGVKNYVGLIPSIKDKILKLHIHRKEIEFEQLIIRANNCERVINTDYFIIDRQIRTDDRKGQMDLIGVYWPRKRRQKNQTVSLSLFEIKFGTNDDIAELSNQLSQYYNAVKKSLRTISTEAEKLLSQKIKLGLFNQPKSRLDALKTIKISKNINDVRLVIVLVDYNPASKLLSKAIGSLKELPFADQISIFHVGFGLWNKNEIETKNETHNPQRC